MDSEGQGSGAGAAAQSEPVQIGKKKHHHWWQDLPRRFSLTRNRSTSESSDAEPEGSSSPVHSCPMPMPMEPPALKKSERRYSETMNGSSEKTSDIRERWNRNYNIPPELFVPPWI